MSKEDKTVLIIDDEEKTYAEPLKVKFEEESEDPDGRYRFVVEIAKDVVSAGDKLRGLSHWDVVVIDRRFPSEKPTNEIYQNLEILQSLNDIGSKAIRIIWTAYSNPKDVIDSMRLGAWDYLLKLKIGKDSSSTYKEVVDSAVDGLNDIRRKEKRLVLSEEASHWFWQHHNDLLRKYPGMFVALRKTESGAWEALGETAHDSLFMLYAALALLGINRVTDPIHIVYVQE